MGIPWWPSGQDLVCRFHGPASGPGQGTEILQATRHNQKQKQNVTLNVFFQTIYGATDYDTVPSENNITSPDHCHPVKNYYPRVTWLMPTILNPPTTRLLEIPKESLRSHRQAFFWFRWTSLDDRRVTEHLLHAAYLFFY